MTERGDDVTRRTRLAAEREIAMTGAGLIGIHGRVERPELLEGVHAFSVAGHAIDGVAGFEIAFGFGGEARPWDGFKAGRVYALARGFANSITPGPQAVQGLLNFEQGLLF